MSVDRGTIDAQLREIGEGDRWWELREFRDLPYILQQDERLVGLAVGKLLWRRRPRLRPSSRWLFVATNHRLLCLQQKGFARSQLEIPPGHILAMAQRSTLRYFQVRLTTPSGLYRLLLPKQDALRFTTALASLLPQPAAPRLPPDLEPLELIPGFRTITSLPAVSSLVAKMTVLSPPEYVTRDQVTRLETELERLQQEMEQARQQIAFLQDLLETRAEHAVLPGSDRGL